jgi:putative membrane protein
MMRLPLAFAAVSLIALGACTPESADDTAANAVAPTNDTMPDATMGNDSAAMPATPTDAQGFMAAAGASDLYEIQSSKLALDKSENASVKDFANMMITDHTKTTQAVKDAAQQAGLTAPEPMLTPEQQQMIDALQPLSGHEFDVKYAEQQLPAHQQALLLMTNYSQNGDTPALRDAAQSAIPIIEHHLASLKQMTGLDR